MSGAWVADRLLGAERTLFASAITVMLGHLALALLPGLGGVAVPAHRAHPGARGLPPGVRAGGGGHGDRPGPVRGVPPQPPGVGVRGPHPLPRSAAPRAVGVVVGIAVLVVAGFATGILRPATLSTAVAIVVALIALVVFAVMLSSPKVDDTERSRVRAFVPLFLASVVFWSLFQQTSTVVEIYSDSRLDRFLFGFQIPVVWPNSLEPLFVVILAPLFALLWTKLGDRGPSTPVKFALGAGGMGVAFLLFLPWAGGTGPTTPLLALAGILAVFALAELNLSPVGLSLSTRIGPEAFRNQTVALYYLSVALGTALSGTMAGYYDPSREAAYFGTIGGAAIVLAGVLLALTPWIRRAMAGVR